MAHMPTFPESVFLISYFAVLAILCVYSLHRYYLVYLFHRHKSRPLVPAGELRHCPRVTIQTPIYNERYVIPRLLDALRRLDYPRERLEIQVLDDSTDETPQIVQRLAEGMRREGFDIHHIRRASRAGFKAGALGEGLKSATGEFIAIFDADFRPGPRFLSETLPYFSDKKTGMVQARWGYANRDYSLLTRLQAIFLDAHFIIEHLARNRSGSFFNFNGTAGIWRKQCLLSAGGWQADTLTEDLDISYRAQLRGWRFVFAPHVVAPSELPVEVTAFRLQQHRWAKGSVQTARKLLGGILASHYSWKVKTEAFFHLTGNLTYPLLLYFLATMLPSMVIRHNMGWEKTLWIELPILLIATPSMAFFYLSAQRALYKNWYTRILHVPVSMSLGIGMAINNSKAVLEALLGVKSAFRRTPKHGIEGNRGFTFNKSYSQQLDPGLAAELMMAVYLAGCIYYAFIHELYIALPFLFLFAGGFAYLSLLTLAQCAGRIYYRHLRPRLRSSDPLPRI